MELFHNDFTNNTVAELLRLVMLNPDTQEKLMNDALALSTTVVFNGDTNAKNTVKQAMAVLEDKMGDIDIYRNTGEVIPHEDLFAIAEEYQTILNLHAAVKNEQLRKAA